MDTAPLGYHQRNTRLNLEYLDSQGRSDAAVRDCNQVLERGISDKVRILKLRSDCYRKLHDTDKALADLNECIKLRQGADLFQRRFALLRIKGRNKEALRDIEEAVKLDEWSGDYLYLRGKALTEIGEHQRALKDFELASRRNPNNERFTTARDAAYHKLKISRKKPQ